jgi:deoxyribodipyrimidine photolyase-related protein
MHQDSQERAKGQKPVTATFFVLGDQLSTDVSPWPDLAKGTVVLFIESEELIRQPRHLTRVGLYLSAMRNFAEQVRSLGFTVDYRHAPSFTEGLRQHRHDFGPDQIVMNAPRGRLARKIFQREGIEFLADPFYLTDLEEMRSRKKRPATLEAFQREQRRRLNVLMDGPEPVGGQWNFDTSNREPLPRDGGMWPEPWSHSLSPDEEALVSSLAGDHPGNNSLQYWPRTRSQALSQLHDAIERIIPTFGPYEDAASYDNWHLSHSRLSAALNLGLLHPSEVVMAVETSFRSGQIPLASAEGFIRQVTGWREWVWVLHHLRSDEYVSTNVLRATNALSETWRSMSSHEMRCLDGAFRHLNEFSWNHHIERLMVLANAATLSSIDPKALMRWMLGAYVDGAEWVMEANVIGMGTFADGGETATKPYVGGGNYVSKMTNFCRGCRFNPTERTGPSACPLTTLYWDFFLRNEELLAKVHRVAPQRRAALARPDREEIREQAPRAVEVILSGRAWKVQA